MTDEASNESTAKPKKKKGKPLTEEQKAEHRKAHGSVSRKERQARILAGANDWAEDEKGFDPNDLPPRPSRSARRGQGHVRQNVKR